MKRDKLLDEAKNLVNGPRAKDYGDAYENHERVRLPCLRSTFACQP